jgi:glucose/mannose-6-phosphate isomerase
MVLPVTPSIVQPRAAIGAVVVPTLLLLSDLGFAPTAETFVADAIALLKERRDDICQKGGEADHIARRIGRTFPLVYGSKGPASAAAGRWKTQCNENAKVPAFSGVLPELCHNEIAGFGQGGDITRQVMSLILLRTEDETKDVGVRFSFIEETLREITADIIEIRTSAPDRLSQFFELSFLGDVTSLFLAAQEGVDPGPVPILSAIKAAL